MKQTLLGASAFAVGVLLYRTAFFERRWRRPFLAVGFLGVAIVLVLIAEVVVRAPLINPNWRAVLYLVALLFIAVGFLGDVVRTRKKEAR